MVSLTSKIEFN